MSNQYIVKFIKDTRYPDSTTNDGFLELISDKGCPTILIRTCKDSSDPKNENLLNMYVSKNMGKIVFDDDSLICSINNLFKSYKIIFDSSSSSAYTDFKNNFEVSLNSKFDTEYYPKSGRLMYVGEILYKEQENEDKTKSQTIVANGSGTLYYDKPGQKIKYYGEFADGNFDGAGKFYSLDGKVVLIANNISNGIPVQKGKLDINFGNKKEIVEIKFTQLWEILGISSKDSIRNCVTSHDFIDSVLQVYWNNKEITIEQAKFKDLPIEDKNLLLFNEIKDLKKSLSDTQSEILKYQKENVKLLQTLSNNMLITVISVTAIQIIFNWII